LIAHPSAGCFHSPKAGGLLSSGCCWRSAPVWGWEQLALGAKGEALFSLILQYILSRGRSHLLSFEPCISVKIIKMAEMSEGGEKKSL